MKYEMKRLIINSWHFTAAPGLHGEYAATGLKALHFALRHTPSLSLQVLLISEKHLYRFSWKAACWFLSSVDLSILLTTSSHRVEFKNSRSSARFLSLCNRKVLNTKHIRILYQLEKQTWTVTNFVFCFFYKDESTCLSFFDFFTFILIFFPEIMLYLPPFFLSFKYLEIWTGPELSSFVFLSFLRLCRFSFFPFFLCCFSFFLFFDCFLDLLLESLLLELLRLWLDECDEPDEEDCDEDEDEDDEDDELEEDEEEDLLRLRFRFFFSRPLLVDLLLSSVLDVELDTLHSAFVDILAAIYN